MFRKLTPRILGRSTMLALHAARTPALTPRSCLELLDRLAERRSMRRYDMAPAGGLVGRIRDTIRGFFP